MTRLFEFIIVFLMLVVTLAFVWGIVSPQFGFDTKLGSLDTRVVEQENISRQVVEFLGGLNKRVGKIEGEGV